jgi:carbon-monoxide dehydrogenase medium subunit
VFDYAAPATVAEVLSLLADAEREVKVLAGGQSLIPMLNMRLARPEVLVDIGRVGELAELRVDERGWLRVGAAVRQATAQHAAEVREGWPLLAEAIGRIGHPQIRNRGTVGGSLAHHDPAAELPTAAIALDAEVVLAGPAGRRTLPATEFFVGTFQTALAPDELLVEIGFPPCTGTGWAFAELARRHGDFATIGVAVRLRRRAGRIAEARVVFCGAGTTPVRVLGAERALIGAPETRAGREAAGEQVRRTLRPPDDVHATGAYRREAAVVLLHRAIDTAGERCE